MANQIDRDAFVKRNVLKNPIPYTRGTDLLPIVIHFRDFQIPSGATARVFVAKSDGNAVYTTATIDGNDVTVDVTGQMFIELGTALMQISIMDGEEELVSFVQPVDVQQNLKAGDLPASTTDVSFLDEAIEQANDAVSTATTAAQQAATAVQNANKAIEDANEAISDLNTQIASLNTNFASLAQTVSISQLQTTAKNLVGAVNELNGKTLLFKSGDGNSLSDIMSKAASDSIISVKSYSPASDGPSQNNAIWNYLILHFKQEDGLYSKIFAMNSDVTGSNIKSWIGAKTNDGQINWAQIFGNDDSRHTYGSVGEAGRTVTFNLERNSAYMIVLQHSGGANYYTGIIAVDSNDYIKIVKLSATNDTVFTVVKSGSYQVRISSTLTYWNYTILKL